MAEIRQTTLRTYRHLVLITARTIMGPTIGSHASGETGLKIWISGFQRPFAFYPTGPLRCPGGSLRLKQ